MNNNFIWGDYISDEAVDLVVKFYNTQKFLPYFDGEVEQIGSHVVDTSVKESKDLPVTVNIMDKYLKPYQNELQRILDLDCA